MTIKRKQNAPEFTLKVALEALKGLKAMGELAGQYEVHPTQVPQWKKQLKPAGPRAK